VSDVLVIAKARFKLLEEFSPPGFLVILDLGPWTSYRTVTSSAQEIVRTLWDYGLLAGGKRLLYIDSLGNTDEILHASGDFRGFRAGWNEAGPLDERLYWQLPRAMPGDRDGAGGA